jgi:hypothetical protein
LGNLNDRGYMKKSQEVLGKDIRKPVTKMLGCCEFKSNKTLFREKYLTFSDDRYRFYFPRQIDANKLDLSSGRRF